MLLKNWKMTYAEHTALPCEAPCSMYSVLLENRLIEDPFYGLNEKKATPLSDRGCVFETEFDVDAAMLAKEHVELVFLGLDTICRITLGGKLLAETMNMHRRYIFDVKGLLTLGKNTVRLEFASPTAYFREMNNKHFLQTNADTIPGAAHLRKALFMSGWDWGPTLPDMGIFRPVLLETYDGDRIENIFIRQHHEDGTVRLDIEVETRHETPCNITVTVDGQTVTLDESKRASLTVANPRLWWARGYGEQYLYDVIAKITDGEDILDEKTQKLGLRTLTVSTAPDETGSEFCFVLNGEKIFAMGANYVPIDNILSRITPERIDAVLHDAMDANFNCLRIWGGGYYPEDEFYDLCDRYGIMVWQDTMVACCNVWMNPEMTEEYKEETVYNVKRLRHHASLGIWCGNNEMEDAVLCWGGFGGNNDLVRADYIELYERILPHLLGKYAPDTFYWQSSPSSGGGFDEPSNPHRGDVHFWTVWHGGKSFTEYRKHNFRFCSEYGFESFPSMKTVRAFCPEEEQNCFSRTMENHQKCKGGNQKILMYLADNYRYPSNMEELVYASQLLQADAIKYGVEHFRRCRGYTMGSVYWQFNDCWPVASWSSVDSYGRRKALHYAARKFYAPVTMSLFLEKGKLTVNTVNETRTEFRGSVRVRFTDCNFTVKDERRLDITLSPLSSQDVIVLDVPEGDIYREFATADLYDANGSHMMRQTELYVPPKHFDWQKPTVAVAMQDTDGGVLITLTSDRFAKGVYLDFEGCDPELSANFFDLTDATPYTIKVSCKESAEELRAALRIMSVYDIGR